MKLGILVTTDRHLDQIRGITEAALAKGHTVVIFATDAGTKLLADPRFSSLSCLSGVTMSYCDYSLQREGSQPVGVPKSIVPGSQYESAIMASESDKLIVL